MIRDFLLVPGKAKKVRNLVLICFAKFICENGEVMIKGKLFKLNSKLFRDIIG